MSATRGTLPRGLGRAAPAVLLVPAGVYLWFVLRFGVNVPYQDDWVMVPLVHSVRTGSLTLSGLWAQHLQNRVLFPNLAMLAILVPTGFDTRWEMLASVGLLVLGFVLFAIAHHRITRRSWAVLVPAAFVCFSLIQYLTALHGYALSLYLIVATASGALLALVASARRPGIWLGVAVVLALVASYSSLQGMAVWPAGLTLLAARGRAPRIAAVWIAMGLTAGAVYLVGFHLGSDGHSAAWAVQHPAPALQFLVLLPAAVIPEASRLGIGIPALTAVGVVIWGLALWLLGVCMGRRGSDQPLAVAAGMIAMVLAIDILIALGRARLGIGFALAPRYTVFNVWLLAATYLGVVELYFRRRSVATQLALAVVVLSVLAQIGGSLHSGLQAGPQFHTARVTEIALVRHYQDARPAEVYQYALQDTSAFQPLAAILERDHLSVFRTH